MVDRACGRGVGGCVDPVHVDRPHGGAGPLSTVDRAPVRGACARRGGRRAAVAPLAPLGARHGGGSWRGEASQGHQRVWLDETSALEGSLPRNDDGKEKLDGGGADFDENGGGAANLRLGVLR